MKLSEFDGKYYQCVADGEFSTLGNYVSSIDCPYLSFAENETYLKRACEKAEISCIICTEELSAHPVLLASGKGIAVSPTPRASFYKLHNWLVSTRAAYAGEDADTVIGENCRIHETAVISPKGVVIGNNVEIQEYVVIKPGTVLGDDVVVFSGAVLGGETHVVTKDEHGNQFLVRQVGKLYIHDHVSIGYHTLIAKGSFPLEYTEVGEYTKIESGVELSHNSKVGRNCLITGQSHICGNCQIGDHVRLSPKSIISNRLTVADNATVDLGSVVVSNVKEGTRVAGNFAIEHSRFLLWHRNKLRLK